MKLIIGLGNPGDEYAGTRHNIGRRLVEYIAAKEKAGFKIQRSQKAALASVSWNGENVSLAYPLSYMNLSGEAVAALVRFWKVAAQDVLIVVDDIALPFGKFRLRAFGSSGGHNGLASIEAHLATREYPRLRIGIGTSSGDGEPLRDYVLSPFRVSEERSMKRLLESGMEACRDWAAGPMAKVMSRVNAFEI